MIIPRGFKFPRREGIHVFRRCEGQDRGEVWRSLYLFLKKHIILVIFRGGGGGSGSPHPTLSMDS